MTSRKAFIIFAVLISLFLCSVGLFGFLELSIYRDKIIPEIEKSLGVHIVVSEGVSYKFFGLRLKNVRVLHYSGEISSAIDSIDVDFKKTSLLRFKMQTKSLTLKNGQVNFKNCTTIRYDLPYKILLKNIKLRIYRLLLDMDVKEGSYISLNGQTQIRADVIGRDKGQYKFAMFRDYVNGKSSVSFTTSEGNLDVALDKHTKRVSGGGNNLLSLISDFTVFKTESNQKNNFKINGMFDAAENEFALKVDSEILDLFIQLKKSGNAVQLEIDSKNIDMDSLRLRNFQGADFTDYFHYIIPKDANSTINIKVDNLTVRGKSVRDLNLSAVVSNAKISIKEFKTILPGNVVINTTGDIENQAGFSRFLGNVKAEGMASKDFLEWIGAHDTEGIKEDKIFVDADLLVAPQMFIVSNARALFPFFGCNASLNYKKGTTENKIRGEIEITGLDFDNEHLLNRITSRIKSLNTYYTNLRLKFINSTINSKKVEVIEVNFNSEEGKNISFFNVKSKNVDFKGKMILDVENKDLVLEVKGEKMDADLVKLPKLFGFNNQGNKTGIIWATERIHNIDKSFRSEIKADFDTVILGGKLLESFSFRSTSRNDNINIEKLYFKSKDAVFDLVLHAGIGRESNAVKSNFSIKNFNIRNFLREALYINYASGYFNISGELNSSGVSMMEIMQNLSGSIKLRGSEVKIDGVDFATLSSMLQDVQSQEQLDSITRIKVFGGSTEFKSISGSSNIKNGIMASSFNFLTDTTSGAVSSRLSLVNMETNTIAKIFFVVPKWENQVADVEMNVEGTIWNPKVFFDNDKIYRMIQSKLRQSNDAA